jgi:hypothetical protein
MSRRSSHKAFAEAPESDVDIETIRRALGFNTGRFPIEAVRAAIEQREAMIPVLLVALQEAADTATDTGHEPSSMLPIYAMYLLAQFREQAAYPLLVKFYSMPGDISLRSAHGHPRYLAG